MSEVYRGTVKGNVVVLPEGAKLAEGATVEVRVVAPSDEEAAELDRERLLMRRLMEAGLLSRPKPSPVLATNDRTPVHVRGRPLSEDILEERR